MENITKAETIEYYPTFYLVHYGKRLTEIERCDAEQLAKWLDKGYQVVDQRTHYDCKDSFYDWHQARIRKTHLQKLRRLQGFSPANTRKPSKVKSKGAKAPKIQTSKPKSLAEILKEDSNIED
jgi:hypothetical protein